MVGGPNLPPARLSYGGCVWRIGDPHFFSFFLNVVCLFGGRCRGWCVGRLEVFVIRAVWMLSLADEEDDDDKMG